MRSRSTRVGEEVDLLFGKVDRRLDVHARFGHRFGQRMHGDGELALQRAQRCARRLRRAAVDQIGDRFGLGQVELVVEEGARLNSPGCAMRAPSSSTRASSMSMTTGPPWPCSSSTSSPVNDAGAGK